MRVSTDTESLYYFPPGSGQNALRVLVDGQVRGDVIEADSGEGWADVVVPDADAVDGVEGGAPAAMTVQRIYGYVTFRIGDRILV